MKLEQNVGLMRMMTVKSTGEEDMTHENIPDNTQDVEAETTNPSPRLVPEDPSPENIHEVRSPDPFTPIHSSNIYVGYKLPLRHNHGKPPNRHSPDLEEMRSKYPISNYV